jgi:hypothetical protein
VEVVRAHRASSRPTYLRILVELAIVTVALGAVVAGVLLREARQPLDSKDLKIAAADLNSLAAEGVLLASQSPGSSVTQDYFDVQTRTWHEKVEAANEELRASPPANDQQDAYEKDVSLAGDLTSVARHLAGSRPNKSERASSLEKLRTLETQASALRSSLRRDANTR